MEIELNAHFSTMICLDFFKLTMVVVRGRELSSSYVPYCYVPKLGSGCNLGKDLSRREEDD